MELSRNIECKLLTLSCSSIPLIVPLSIINFYMLLIITIFMSHDNISSLINFQKLH